MSVAIPSEALLLSLGIRAYDININGKELTIDLIPLIIQHFDIILGMDGLALNHIVINYENKRVLFQVANKEVFDSSAVVHRIHH